MEIYYARAISTADDDLNKRLETYNFDQLINHIEKKKN